jgi:predicted homoserine dehydrogenase-like protein
LAAGALPIGLAHGIRLGRDIRRGEVIGQVDVGLDGDVDAVRIRREMERVFAGAIRPPLQTAAE